MVVFLGYLTLLRLSVKVDRPNSFGSSRNWHRQSTIPKTRLWLTDSTICRSQTSLKANRMKRILNDNGIRAYFSPAADGDCLIHAIMQGLYGNQVYAVKPIRRGIANHFYRKRTVSQVTRLHECHLLMTLDYNKTVAFLLSTFADFSEISNIKTPIEIQIDSINLLTLNSIDSFVKRTVVSVRV